MQTSSPTRQHLSNIVLETGGVLTQKSANYHCTNAAHWSISGCQGPGLANCLLSMILLCLWHVRWPISHWGRREAYLELSHSERIPFIRHACWISISNIRKGNAPKALLWSEEISKTRRLKVCRAPKPELEQKEEIYSKHAHKLQFWAFKMSKQWQTS